MKLNYYFFAIVWALSLGNAFSQSAKEHKADLRIERQSFDKGIGMYTSLLAKADSTTQMRIEQKLARVYYNIRQYQNALHCYQFILDAHQEEKLSVEDACDILTLLNRMDSVRQAENWAALFANNDQMMKNQKFRNIQRSILGIEIPISHDTLKYEVANESFNTPYSEFGMTAENDSSLVFIRSDAGGGDRNTRAMFRGSRFYNYNLNTKKTCVNTRFPMLYQAGPATFYKNGAEMIYTDNNIQSGGAMFKKTVTKQRNLQLVLAKYNNKREQWVVKSSIFKSDDPNISYLHPSLVNNDQTLFFAANIPGGYGGTDIYKSNWDSAKQSWGTPINLGPSVNTAADEIYPIVKNNILYFSSNGHIGLGGFDIYGMVLNGDCNVSDSTLIYLPSPINTKFNDYAYFLNADNQSGFFTSDRSEGKGLDDIYSFQAIVKERPKAENKLKSIDSVAPQLDLATREILLAVVKGKEMGNIYFDFDKWNIKTRYIPVLDSILSTIQNSPDSSTRYLLMGSADPRGSSQYNIILSKHRAETVKKWLVSKGIAPDRLETKARGEILLTDEEILKMLNIAPGEPLTDAELIRKAYHEARRVTIKPIFHSNTNTVVEINK